MSQWSHHLAWVLVTAVAAAAGFLLGGSGTARTHTVTVTACTWGASSVGPVTKINGRIVPAHPRVKQTGCVPR